MDAAEVLFRQRGYTRVNVGEISAAAVVTKRTLYSGLNASAQLK
jgi:hypothetical protein